MPPILVDESNYGEWENDLEIWELFTDLDVEKRGTAIYLSLIGRAHNCVRSLNHQEIDTENGIRNVLEILEDKNTHLYLAFKEFYDYCSSPVVSITDFL